MGTAEKRYAASRIGNHETGKALNRSRFASRISAGLENFRRCPANAGARCHPRHHVKKFQAIPCSKMHLLLHFHLRETLASRKIPTTGTGDSIFCMWIGICCSSETCATVGETIFAQKRFARTRPFSVTRTSPSCTVKPARSRHRESAAGRPPRRAAVPRRGYLPCQDRLPAFPANRRDAAWPVVMTRHYAPCARFSMAVPAQLLWLGHYW